MKKSIKALIRNRTFLLSGLILLCGVVFLIIDSVLKMDLAALIQLIIIGLLVLLVALRVEVFGSRQSRKSDGLKSRLLQIASASNQNLTISRENLKHTVALRNVSSTEAEETHLPVDAVGSDLDGEMLEEVVEGEKAIPVSNDQLRVFEEFLIDVDSKQRSIVSGLSFLQIESLRREISRLQPDQILTSYSINDANILHSTARISQIALGENIDFKAQLDAPTVIILAEDEFASTLSMGDLQDFHDTAFIVCKTLDREVEVEIPSSLTEVVPSGVAFRIRVFVPARLAVSQVVRIAED